MGVTGMANKFGKPHSTLSRRDFMKVLGLGGVGLGLAGLVPAAPPPKFNDMDELLASPQAEHKRPAWVREVDKPTVEIDWNMFQQFDYREVMFVRGFEKAMGATYIRWAQQVGRENVSRWLNQNKPGFTLRDYALYQGTAAHAFPTASFLGHRRSPTPGSLGVPRWEGTPEENSRMVRALMRILGANEVAFLELDENTEKIFYTHDIDGKVIRIEHTLNADEGEDYRIIPKRCRWVIVYTVKMSYEMVRRLPSWASGATAYLGYAQGPFLQDRFQEIIRTLGYTCLGECRPNALGSSTGFGVMCGLGEMCRIEHQITPERGISNRVFKMVTDLPLAPTKPINTGVMDFCRTCKKCAELCPANVISSATEPTWEIPGPWKRPGVKSWFKADPRCISYWRQTGTACGFCFAVCPLNRPQSSAYFNTMRSTIASTAAFNKTFRKIDDLLGWGARRDYESFWELDFQPYGWD
jgi:epoxyqueuosine reductase